MEDNKYCKENKKEQHKVIYKLIDSIANEEKALGHIIYQEGEKIEKAICISNCIDDLLEIDKSVQETLKEITKSELLLLQKLDESHELICKKCL